MATVGERAMGVSASEGLRTTKKAGQERSRGRVGMQSPSRLQHREDRARSTRSTGTCGPPRSRMSAGA